MSTIDCGKGHFYNSNEHSNCPYCGVQVDIGSTVPVAGGTRRMDGDVPPPRHDANKTRPVGESRPPPNANDRKTKAYWGSSVESEIDPVVGWLVCIKGPDRGRDYRIRNGCNFIGREASMGIAITGDDTISRENHAELIYDPLNRNFFIAPGSSRGLIYLNKALVLTPTPLVERGIIQLGKTEVLFISLCGETFNWEEQ